MPGHFVFPGGRVDPVDLAIAADFPLPAKVLDRLCAGPPARYGPRQAAASALAAIRETFEEVGLAIGLPGQMSGARGTWAAFAGKGLRPVPERLVPLARAITPPGAPRRFDARFFMMDAGGLAASLPETPPTDEFDAVEWVPLDRAENFSLAAITQRVLYDLGQRIADGSWQDPSRAIPFYRVVKNRFVREYL
ncbi:NUDIX domain-containing protein [Aurantimonas sp. VKM B-3413]|uniref:NUDIX domain-containing protein n=1 Tax=Aurantimonas sp. VKM B-3413 TaxID=2779401 RepID=UPI00351D8EA7